MKSNKDGASNHEGAERAVIHVVDDDSSFRTAVCRELVAAGHLVRDYGSVAELLQAGFGDGPVCLILDLPISEPDWRDLQGVVTRCAEPPPVIVVAGRASAQDAIVAMKAGAADFFLKPVDGDTLVRAVTRALAQHLRRRRAFAEAAALKARYATLTPRERQVAAMVVAGALNKQIGAALGTAERTVKLHRSNAMEKMGARSLPDLVRAFGQLDDANGGPLAPS